MSFQFKSPSDAFIAVFLLQWIAMILLDRTALRMRIQDLAGVSARVPFVWFGPGTALTYWRLYAVYLLIHFGEDIFGHRAPSKGPGLSGGNILLLIAGMIALVVSGIALRVWHRKRISLAVYGVFRGKLNASFRSLARRARFIFNESIPLYVLPTNGFSSLCSRLRRGAIVPRLLLGELSCREIDSLLARQLALQARRLYDPFFWPLLLVNGVAASLAWAVHLGSVGTGILLLTMLAVEVFLLWVLTPAMIVRAYVYSAHLCGDAEAFFSAQGALERFGGAPMAKLRIEEIGRKIGVSQERIEELNGGHGARALQDRYPTTGSYMDTGL